MGFPYFDMEFSTRFPYSKVVIFIFFSVNEFVISAVFPSAISAISAISADLEMDFLHLKWIWFNIWSTEINIKNTEIQRLHFKRIKSPRKSRK